LRKRNSSIGICGKLRVTAQRFGNALIFVGQNAGKRFEEIRGESCYSFSGKGEREFLYVNQCSLVRRIPLNSPLERLCGISEYHFSSAMVADQKPNPAELLRLIFRNHFGV
jgi:hypothetical protein